MKVNPRPSILVHTALILLVLLSVSLTTPGQT